MDEGLFITTQTLNNLSGAFGKIWNILNSFIASIFGR